jgi:hypothetical protein
MRNEYKTEDGVLDRRKTRLPLPVQWDQQEYYVENRCAPVLKAEEVRMIAA